MPSNITARNITAIIFGAIIFLRAPTVLPDEQATQQSEELSAGFWQWFSTYSNEEGEFFDPLALFELSQLAQNMQDAGKASSDSDNSSQTNSSTQPDNWQQSPSTQTGEKHAQ